MGPVIAFTFLSVALSAEAIDNRSTPDRQSIGQEFQFQQDYFENKCLEGLGCFWNGPPFYHPLYRPFSFLPFNSEFIKTQFRLFSPRNPQVGAPIRPDKESLRQSGFDPRLETKFIIHGFVAKPTPGDYNHIMKDMLLLCGNYNVILVDWSDSNGGPYPQAVANARVVGAQVAQLVLFLEECGGIWPESVHLIGHSLGAHLAGWAGEKLQNLGRITGLDPAGPYFHKAELVTRLDTSDALFVDVIHTNGGYNFLDGLGIQEPIGHIDFYPNGGQKQPGCSASPFADNGNLTNFGFRNGSQISENSCHHGKALTYFIASILSQGCRFEGVPCDSWSSYTEGKCNGGLLNVLSPFPIEMGFHAKKNFLLSEGQPIFLRTTSDPPYCSVQRRVPNIMARFKHRRSPLIR